MKRLWRSLVNTSEKTLDGRSCYLDNIRFALISLVVLAHMIEYSETFPTLYKYIYLFHMPAFVFVSGYFVKPERAAKKTLSLFSLYVVCYIVFFLVGTQLLGKELSFQILNPNPFIGLWYLLSLCLWNLLLPVFVNLKPAAAVGIAFLIGLLAGLDHSIGTFLSLSRVLVFFPFFLLGYCARRYRWLERSKAFRWTPLIAVGVLLAVAYLLWHGMLSIPKFIMTAKRSYETMEMTATEGLTTRGMWYLVAVVMCWAFFMLIPQCRLIVTRLGRNTISVYFFHLIILYCLIAWDTLPAIAEMYSRWSIVLIAVGMTLFFSMPVFSVPFNRILKSDFLRVRERQSP